MQEKSTLELEIVSSSLWASNFVPMLYCAWFCMLPSLRYSPDWHPRNFCLLLWVVEFSLFPVFWLFFVPQLFRRSRIDAAWSIDALSSVSLEVCEIFLHQQGNLASPLFQLIFVPIFFIESCLQLIFLYYAIYFLSLCYLIYIICFLWCSLIYVICFLWFILSDFILFYSPTSLS